MRLADALGLASTALGAPMLLAPRRFPNWIGIRSDRTATALTILVGVRELSGTLTINMMRHRRIGAWARAAGDSMDLLLLTRSFLNRRQDTARLLGAIGAVVGIFAADLYSAIRLSQAEGVGLKDGSSSQGTATSNGGGLDHATSVTILKPEQEVRQALGRFPWSAFDPGNAEAERRLRLVAAPGQRGTELHVAGNGRSAALNQELRRFKALLEAGVEARSEKTPESHSAIRQILQRPAQPIARR